MQLIPSDVNNGGVKNKFSTRPQPYLAVFVIMRDVDSYGCCKFVSIFERMTDTSSMYDSMWSRNY